MLGFALANSTQCKKMSTICHDRLPPVGIPIFEVNVSPLYEI